MPFSSIDVNHMAYLAHVTTAVLVYATLCLTVMQLFSDITDVATISHSFRTNNRRTRMFRAGLVVRRRHHMPRIKSLLKTYGSVVKDEYTTFRAAESKSIKTNALTKSSTVACIAAIYSNSWTFVFYGHVPRRIQFKLCTHLLSLHCMTMHRHI